MAIAALLFVIALIARVSVALVFGEPAYPDAYYYANVARALVDGQGFSIDYIWNFVEVGGRLPAEGVLPIPSNAHWQPLAALVQVPFLWLLGAGPTTAALPFWLAAAAVAPLTYVIGRDAGMPRWQAICAGLLLIMPGAIAPYLGQPDNFALFMLLGSLALWLCGRGLRGDRRSFALGGLVVGLAFLARTDGLLLAVPFALAFGVDLLRPPRGARIGWWPALACLAGFLLITGPWLWRQLEVFGSLSPSAAGGRILFITEYRELYSVSSETTIEAFLSQGPVALLRSRLEGLWSALVIFAVMPLLFVLTPFVLLGAWDRRRDRAYQPWLVYALVFFAFSAIVSAVHVPYGTFLHSAVALVPHAYLLAFVGVAVVVRWVATHRASWDAVRATRNFSFIVVAVVIGVSVLATIITIGAWTRERQARAPVLAALAANAVPGDRVMSPDAGAYRYHGGWPGIVTPDDPLADVEEALRLYDVRWLALESDHLTLGLRPILEGTARPRWLSEPPVEAPPAGDPASESTAPKASPLPAAALYAVCLAPGDTRCDG
jgi:4-amino-4-deoxy-L-arabinose transferase-like glycosyltransferase